MEKTVLNTTTILFCRFRSARYFYNSLRRIRRPQSEGSYVQVLLCAIAKLQKAIISFVMSVCLSVRMEQLVSHWTDFHEI
jgi:hypothetical protein